MKSLYLIIFGLMFAFVVGCEDDSHDTTIVYEDGYSPKSNNSDGTGGQSGSTYNNGAQAQAAIYFNNASSVTITFTVNGVTRVLPPGGSSFWPYQGVANLSTVISGSSWSYTWSDGASHSYIASDNGIPGGFDLN